MCWGEILLQEFGNSGEIFWFVDVEPGGAAGGGEAGGVAGGFGVCKGMSGGPADTGEHIGVGTMGGDGPVAAVFGGGEGDVGGGREHGLDVGVGDGGGVGAEEERGEAGGEGVEHALAEVAGRLEGERNVWGIEIVCESVEVEFAFRKLRKAGEHRMDEEFVEFGCLLRADSSGETSFDTAWHRSLREEQDDGRHGQIVE